MPDWVLWLLAVGSVSAAYGIGYWMGFDFGAAKATRRWFNAVMQMVVDAGKGDQE